MGGAVDIPVAARISAQFAVGGSDKATASRSADRGCQSETRTRTH
jgi:hypothetical protein